MLFAHFSKRRFAYYVTIFNCIIVNVFLAYHVRWHLRFQWPLHPRSGETIESNICNTHKFDWLEEYKSFHHEVINGSRPPRFIVYECMSDMGTICGGLADRMRGAVAAFYLGALTDRAVLINVQGANKFENMFTPNHISWNMTYPDAETVFEEDKPKWLDEIYRKHIESGAHRSGGFGDYFNTRERFIKSDRKGYVYVHHRTDLAPSQNQLKILLSPEPYVAISHHPALRENFFTDVIQHFHAIYEDKQIPDHIQRYINAFEGVNWNGRFSCVFKYIFAPSPLTVMRLHASMIDIVLQMNGIPHTQVSSQYLKYATLPQIDQALKTFTELFLEEYTTTRPSFREKEEDYFRQCLNTISMSLNGNEIVRKRTQRTIGAHLRQGGKMFDKKDQDFWRSQKIHIFTQAITNHIRTTMKHAGNSYVVIFVSDSTVTRHELRRSADHQYVSPHYEKNVPTHVDKTSNITVMQVVEAISEVYLLSLCDALVLSSSGYSALAYQFAERNGFEDTSVIVVSPDGTLNKPRHQYR